MASRSVVSPIAGIVKEIQVSVGDSVALEQEVAIIESMKVEIPVESLEAGKVAEVCVEVAQAVEEGAVLFRLEA